MTHRIGQAAEQIASRLRARVEGKGWKVFTNRQFSLSAEQDELPAYTVDVGPYDPVDSQNTAFEDVILTIRITAVVVAIDEKDARELLMEMHTEAHIAVMEDVTQGLPFLISTTDGGWPDGIVGNANLEGLLLSLELTAEWLLYLRMNYRNPGDN